MKKVSILFIKWYKKNISLFFETKGIKCKYEPTCSQYAIEALEKYGFLKGSFMTIKRLLKCNPFSKGGYDPVK